MEQQNASRTCLTKSLNRRCAIIHFTIALLVIGNMAWGGINPEVVGEIYPIEEKSVLDEIREKANAVDWEKVFDKEKVKEKIKNYQPENLSKLPFAEKDRMRSVSMDYTLTVDIADENGKVIYPKGFTFNPMEYIPNVSIIPVLVIINGEREEEVEWFKTSEYFDDYRVRVLLSDGNFYDLANNFNYSLFYLTKEISERFDIQYTPSIVQASGNAMIVTEVHVQNKKETQ